MTFPANLMKRIMTDIKDVKECKDLSSFGITINVGSNMREFTACIVGPPGTPYEGAKYLLEVKIPTNYPYRPPMLKFATNIWHPNICSQTGEICVDTLKEKWTPSVNLCKALLSVQNLLSNPYADSPQDVDAAIQYRNDLQMFNKTAQIWAAVYNIGEKEIKVDEQMMATLKTLQEMGVWTSEILLSFNCCGSTLHSKDGLRGRLLTSSVTVHQLAILKI